MPTYLQFEIHAASRRRTPGISPGPVAGFRGAATGSFAVSAIFTRFKTAPLDRTKLAYSHSTPGVGEHTAQSRHPRHRPARRSGGHGAAGKPASRRWQPLHVRAARAQGISQTGRRHPAHEPPVRCHSSLLSSVSKSSVSKAGALPFLTPCSAPPGMSLTPLAGPRLRGGFR